VRGTCPRAMAIPSGTYESDRPLVVSWIERSGGRVFEPPLGRQKESPLLGAFSRGAQQPGKLLSRGADTGFSGKSTSTGASSTAKSTSATRERTATRPKASGRCSIPVVVQSRRLSRGAAPGVLPSATCTCTSSSTAFGAPTATRAGRSARGRWSVSFWLCERLRRESLRPGRDRALGPTCIILLESGVF